MTNLEIPAFADARPTRALKSPINPVFGRNSPASECADAYPAVVAMLDAKTRIIECAAGIQWILQKRKRRAGCYPWQSVYFCRTKAGLFRLAPSPKLLALPDYFRPWRDWQAAR